MINRNQAFSRQIVPLIALLLLVWGMLLFNWGKPWFAHHDANGAWISAAVRNFKLDGFDTLRFVPVTRNGRAELENSAYVHHPPLMVWMAVGVSEIFGYRADGSPHEWAIRLIAIFPTIISLCTFYVIARRLANVSVAFWALFFYCISPMTLYFGRMPDHEAPALMFLYFFIAITLKWMTSFSWRATALLAILGILCIWTAWAPAFMLAPIGVLVLMWGTKQHRVGILLVGFVTLIAMIAIPLYYEWAMPGAITRLAEAFIYRTSTTSTSPDQVPLTLELFIMNLAQHMLTTMSFAVTILGLWGIGAMMRQPKQRINAWVLALAIGGFLYLVILRNASNYHDYYKIYLMPAFAIASAWIAREVWRMRPFGWRRYMRPLVFSITACSIIASFYWTFALHGTVNDSFSEMIVTELPPLTEPDDIIVSNSMRPYASASYHAARTIEWGYSADLAFELAERRDEHIVYLYCPLSPYRLPQNNTDALDGLAFDTVLEDCQLYQLPD